MQFLTHQRDGARILRPVEVGDAVRAVGQVQQLPVQGHLLLFAQFEIGEVREVTECQLEHQQDAEDQGGDDRVDDPAVERGFGEPFQSQGDQGRGQTAA